KGDTKLEWLQPSSIFHPPSSPRLTICLIARNEEKFLGQCLKSVRDLARQIIVVDTGSTDRTVEIAKEHGAEVHSFACAMISAPHSRTGFSKPRRPRQIVGTRHCSWRRTDFAPRLHEGSRSGSK